MVSSVPQSTCGTELSLLDTAMFVNFSAVRLFMGASALLVLGSLRLHAMPFQLCLSAAKQCVVSPYQFTVTPTLGGALANEMGFHFKNEGPAASSITDVYFESGFAAIFGGPIRVVNGVGVNFAAAT